jgi:hypothetical protein
MGPRAGNDMEGEMRGTSPSDINSVEYLASIPEHCRYQTYEEHLYVLGLCHWILVAIDGNQPVECSGCNFNDKET